jgi:hypothetical protein
LIYVPEYANSSRHWDGELFTSRLNDQATIYQVPMVIIGKVYANSMLVLINSRMVLGSEETQTIPTVISVLRFGTAPANLADSAIEADNGDVAVDTRAGAELSGCSEPEAV